VTHRSHPLESGLHPPQPSFHFQPLTLVPLTVCKHGIQLRLPLHNLRVRLVPVLPQFRNFAVELLAVGVRLQVLSRVNQLVQLRLLLF